LEGTGRNLKSMKFYRCRNHSLNGEISLLPLNPKSKSRLQFKERKKLKMLLIG
jgi:hypothetical protein